MRTVYSMPHVNYKAAKISPLQVKQLLKSHKHLIKLTVNGLLEPLHKHCKAFGAPSVGPSPDLLIVTFWICHQ